VKITRRDTAYENLKNEIEMTNQELNSSLEIKSISKKCRFEDEETFQQSQPNEDLNNVMR